MLSGIGLTAFQIVADSVPGSIKRLKTEAPVQYTGRLIVFGDLQITGFCTVLRSATQEV